MTGRNRITTDNEYGWERYRWEFPNGYTASVVRGYWSYGYAEGLWEVAVIHDDELVYDTPVTSDVIGRCTEDDVVHLLDQIEALPSREIG